MWGIRSYLETVALNVNELYYHFFNAKNVSMIHEVMNVKLFLPGLLGFGASMVCSVGKDSGVSVPQRPPPYGDKLVIKLVGLQILLLTLRYFLLIV